MKKTATHNAPEPRYDASVLPERLKEARRKTGYSQYDFAVLADIRERNYQQYEAGKVTPPITRIVDIANTHGLDINELLQK